MVEQGDLPLETQYRLLGIHRQAQMASLEVEGSAGGGLVSVTMNGAHEVTKVAIKPDCVDPEDIGGALEDLIKAACNNAAKRVQEQASSGLGGLGSLGF